jgi:uncharacterized alpha-E superfamily protein
VLSRVAHAVYWIGRYLERAENVARFAEVNQYLTLDLPPGAGEQWEPLVDITGDSALFHASHAEATREDVLRFLAFDATYPNSIASCVRMARENARNVRDAITLETWEQIHRFNLLVQQAAQRHAGGMIPYEFFAQVRNFSHLIHGIADDTMSHGETWQFMRLGRMMERADKTARLLDVKYFILLPSVDEVGLPWDELLWCAVLRSASALEMYRKRFRPGAPGPHHRIPAAGPRLPALGAVSAWTAPRPACTPSPARRPAPSAPNPNNWWARCTPAFPTPARKTSSWPACTRCWTTCWAT